MAATKSSNGPVKKVMTIDAKKAHLNPRCKGDVYIELPPEVGAEPGQCGKLNSGCTDSARRRRRGKTSMLRLWEVHGDDFVFGGNDEDLKWVAKVLAAKFVIKVRAILGPEDEDQKDEVLLGRFVRWRGW